ncbi:GNAT family N-acetyltransferase [Oceanobacillus sp. FSL K6-2867]|uniref:GNAT family N-acetyltransferase n=1 Tax=Oceanobacillus sp. FSL K6-2867 TaxID=2954748 RepID=UPI0030DA02AB
MDYVIRKMKKRDMKQVQDVATTSWNATYEGIIPLDVQERFLRAVYSKRNLKRRLRNTVFFVAEVNQRIVGFANYIHVPESGRIELAAIYIYPTYQGGGIGTAFLKAGINEFGVQELYLNVEKNNQIGMNFYRAKGFKNIDEYDDYLDGHALKTVRMVLRVGEK